MNSANSNSRLIFINSEGSTMLVLFVKFNICKPIKTIKLPNEESYGVICRLGPTYP